MATPILRGDDNPILQKTAYTYDWSRGGTYGEEWKGINPAKMFAKWNGQYYTAQTARMSVSNGVAEMQIEWSGSPGGGGAGNPATIQVTLDRWECPEPNDQKPQFEHPMFIAALTTLASAAGATFNDAYLSDAVAAWKKAAAAHQQFTDFTSALKIGNTTIYSPGWAAFVSGYPAEAGYLIRAYRRVANDQTHYQWSQYALRHTTNAPNFWSLNRADVNVNCIYSPALFMSEVTDGSLWYFPMPGRLQFKLAAAVTAFTAVTPTRSNYLIGWLKGASAESAIARGRMEIQTNYVLDQWSSDLYSAAT